MLFLSFFLFFSFFCFLWFRFLHCSCCFFFLFLLLSSYFFRFLFSLFLCFFFMLSFPLFFLPFFPPRSSVSLFLVVLLFIFTSRSLVFELLTPYYSGPRFNLPYHLLFLLLFIRCFFPLFFFSCFVNHGSLLPFPSRLPSVLVVATTFGLLGFLLGCFP